MILEDFIDQLNVVKFRKIAQIYEQYASTYQIVEINGIFVH